MLNVFFGSRASTANYLWDFLVQNKLCVLGVAPSFLGMDFWGVWREEGLVPEGTEDSLCCRDLLLIFSAWCWEFPAAL